MTTVWSVDNSCRPTPKLNTRLYIFCIETNSLGGGAYGEDLNVATKSAMHINVYGNYGSILFSFRDMTTERTVDDQMSIPWRMRIDTGIYEQIKKTANAERCKARIT